MAEHLGDQGGFKSKPRGLRKFVTSISLTLLLAFGAKFIGAQVGRQAAHKDVMRVVEQESLSEGAPTGFMGAKWLMSMSEVRSLFPNAVQSAPDTVRLEATAFARPAVVDFEFTGGALLLVIITFRDKKTESTYRQTQGQLLQGYGAFTEPARTSREELASEKRFTRVMIRHLLYELSGIRIEQVLIFRHNG